MTPTTVLVTGARGQVGADFVDTMRALSPPGADRAWQPDGRAVQPEEFRVVAPAREDLDVTDPMAVTRQVELYRPNVIVNLAAYTKVDAAETDESACLALNRDAVIHLSRVAQEFAAHFVTISSDFVFDGTKGAPYVEDDPANPLNVYGRSKLEGELGCSSSDTIVRTSWVMGVRGRNVAHLIARRVREGLPVRFVNDQFGTATFAADLSRALVSVVRERPGGIWHLANEGVASWYEIACEIARGVCGDESLVSPIATSELDPAPAARRPARTDLATHRWRQSGHERWPTWQSGISRFLADC